MRAAVAAGHGVVTARRLAEAGIDATTVARWVRRGVLVAVRRGVYTTRELWDSWDEFRERPIARVRAAHATLRVAHWFSHDSAAVAHGVRLLSPPTEAVHVTREDVRGTRSRHGIEHHGARVPASRVTQVDGLPMLDIPRTVVDLAREHGYLAGLVAADGALWSGTPRTHLAAAAREMYGWPFSVTVRAVVEDADGGAESVGETLMRDLVVSCGLDLELETQFPVATRRGVRWCDVRVGRHLFEFDGALQYAEDNPSGQSPTTVVWEEKRRQDFITGFKTGVSRITTHDCRDGRRAAEARVMREFLDTCDRFGTDITDLAPYIVRRPRP